MFQQGGPHESDWRVWSPGESFPIAEMLLVGYAVKTRKCLEMFLVYGGGFPKIFNFTLIFAEMIQFDDNIFQMRWFNHLVVHGVES